VGIGAGVDAAGHTEDEYFRGLADYDEVQYNYMSVTM
jgi:hypothetical protein